MELKTKERQKIEHERIQAEKYKKIKEQNESMRINFKNKVMRIIDLPSHTTQFDVYHYKVWSYKCIYMGIDYESKLQGLLFCLLLHRRRLQKYARAYQ